jgi:hypothetical protein
MARSDRDGPAAGGRGATIRWARADKQSVVTLLIELWSKRLLGVYMSREPGKLTYPKGKIYPTGNLNTVALPSKPTSELGFGTAGIGGKLVFVGAAITTLLALTDQLDPVLADSQQLTLAVTSIVAVLVAGAAPLAVLGTQVRYRPRTSQDGPVAGNEILVASIPGVVLGSTIIAAAVAIQIAALRWAAHEADIGDWVGWNCSLSAL